MRIISLLVVCLFLESVRAGEPVRLEWRLPKGKVLPYRFKHGEVRTVDIAKKQFEARTQTEFEWKWTVVHVDGEGVATLEQKMTALRMDATAKDFEFHYASGTPHSASDEYQKKLNDFLDQVCFFGIYTVRLRPDGRIVDVRGLSKILEEKNPGKNILDFHGLDLRDDSFAWFLQQALGQLPPPKTIAKTWRVSVDRRLAGLGPLSGQMEFSRKGAEELSGRKLEKITCSGQAALDLDMTWLGAPLAGKLQTDKISGAILFDVHAGALENSDVTVGLKGDLLFGNNSTPLGVRYEHTLLLQRIR